MRLVVCFDNIGPYHTARLGDLSQRCDLFVLQYRKTSIDYQWATRDSAPFNFATVIENGEIVSPRLAYQRIDSALTKAKPNAIAIPGWASGFAHMLMKWSLNNRIPMILMSDSQAIDFSRTKVKEWLKSQLTKLFSSALVAGTKHQEYLRSLGFEDSRIRHGYDVVDNNYFMDYADTVRNNATASRKKLGLPESYILCCARLVEKKNLSYLVNSYSRYLANHLGSRTEPPHLIIVGDGPMKEDLFKKIAACGLSDKVHLPGFVSYEHIPAYFALADWFVLPSSSEQWGLVVNEAMASGLPVVVSNRCGCAHDLVFDGVNGFVFDPTSESALVKAFLKMEEEIEAFPKMAAASRRIISQWNLGRFSDAILDAANVACSAPVSSSHSFGRLALETMVFVGK